MQAAETACLWKYQFNHNESSSSNLFLSKGAMSETPYLNCTEGYACKNGKSSEALFYCAQCKSLQCLACEREIHKKMELKLHQRIKFDEMEDEYCSVNQNHSADLYCPTCQLVFCKKCSDKQHQQNDGREHRPFKCRDDLLFTSKKKTDQILRETKSIPMSNNSHTKKETVRNEKQTGAAFEDINVDASDDGLDSPPIRNQNISPSKITKSTGFRQDNQSPKQDNFNQQMLADSLIDIGDGERREKLDRSSYKPQSDSEENTAFILIDANERLTVNNKYEFIQRLKAPRDDLLVKCVSIIGNTGDGKSYTLNKVFFNDEERFRTSPASESCTMGVWSALDENQSTLLFDTEGLLGLSQNANIRNRLLLKVMCVSDIIIYRTRAPKLTNDMFQFLSDASNAFTKYFHKELEGVMKNCGMDGLKSLPGPTLVIFHETQHTSVLQEQFDEQKTAVQQLKERFGSMNLSYSAYHSIDYVGVQTRGDQPTNFNSIKSTITSILEDNNIRSARPLSVIFKALKALNEKFNHNIPPSMPSTLPDEFFACCFRCLCCESKCTIAANHQKDNLPHQCDKKCSYNIEYDNEVWKCLACHREGRDTIVYGKLITRNDGLVQGLIRYVWSGFVIECPKHGEIYRSRKYWYGNSDPKDVTQAEIVHVWPGEPSNRVASDVTPRKCVEMLMTAGSYLSAPTKLLSETLADQVAPAYWVPNKDAHKCGLCQLQFGSDFSKHHCRSCGHVFCDTCSKTRRIIAWIDPENPVRVCKNCFGNPKPRPPSSSPSVSDQHRQSNAQSKSNGYETSSSGESTNTVSSGEHISELCLTPTDIFDIEQPGAGPVTAEIPTTRRVYETFVSGLEKIGANYPITFIRESTRPNYWRPDHECKVCFICKTEFNNTTNRLHHCRNCGEGVCEKCSRTKRCVPERDWLTSVRVCDLCNDAMNESTSERK